MKHIQKYFVAITWIVLAVAASGCGKKDPAAVVQQRAVERWNLLISHQAVKAYDYLSPGYRTTHTLEQYVAFVSTARLRWKAAEVTNQKCDSDVCVVTLMINSVIPGQLANIPHDVETQAPVTERWVSIDGQWYFLPDSKINVESIVAPEKKLEGPTPPPPAQPAPGQPAPAPTVQPPPQQQK